MVLGTGPERRGAGDVLVRLDCNGTHCEHDRRLPCHTAPGGRSQEDSHHTGLAATGPGDPVSDLGSAAMVVPPLGAIEDAAGYNDWHLDDANDFGAIASIVGVILQAEGVRRYARGRRPDPLPGLPGLESAAHHLSSGGQSGRLRMGAGEKRRGTSHVLVWLDPH